MADLAMGSTAAEPAPERIVARDLARRGIWIAPLFVVVGAIGWGTDGALSAAFALVLVLGNFLLAAGSPPGPPASRWSADGTVLIGYIRPPRRSSPPPPSRCGAPAGSSPSRGASRSSSPTSACSPGRPARLGLPGVPRPQAQPVRRAGSGRAPLTVRSDKGLESCCSRSNSRPSATCSSGLISFGLGLQQGRPDLLRGAGHHARPVLRRSGKRHWCPPGHQNVAESAVDFVDDSIIMQTIGPGGHGLPPFLLRVLLHLLLQHLRGRSRSSRCRPTPAWRCRCSSRCWSGWSSTSSASSTRARATSRTSLFPPGRARRSTSSGRPSSSSRRSSCGRSRSPSVSSPTCSPATCCSSTFAVLSAACGARPSVAIVLAPFVVLVGLTGFEVLVAFLQAFIFTILTAVYIGGAMHPEH